MRLLLYTCGIILLQLLLHTSASVIPSNAPTVPTDTSLLLPNPITRRIWPDPRHRFFVITQAAGLTFFVRFHVLELVPRTDALATLAANDLLRFYKAAFAVANALWAYDEPKTVRRARMNGVLLTFSSEAPIAWDFMKAFFEHIIERTQGGLVGGYAVTCVAEIGNAIVHITLSLPPGEVGQAARAARGI